MHHSYEADIRAELLLQPEHGWFTSAADNHSKHEVCDQDKTIVASAVAGKPPQRRALSCVRIFLHYDPLPAPAFAEC